MAEYTLTSNTGSFILYKQNNTFSLKTNKTYVNSDIEIESKVVKAVLTTDTATNVFDIQVPNGTSTVTFNFAVDASGNVLVT